MLAGGAALAGLSVRALAGTPGCGRPWWFPARAGLRALAGHGVFEAMAESAGPFGPVVGYRRAGCAEEFWFTPAGAVGPGRAVVFWVRHGGPGGALAVQASVRDAPAAGDGAVARHQRAERRAGLRPDGARPNHDARSVVMTGRAGYRKEER